MAKFNLKQLSKDLARNDILVPHIDLYQAKGNFPPTWDIQISNFKEPDPYFHPSGDCFTSSEQLYLEKTGQAERRTTSFALRRVFDCGHFWHGYYQSILIEMGFVKAENVELPVVYEKKDNERNILWTGKGTLDFYDVDIPGQPRPYIVDIKTMNDAEFDDGPRPETLQKWEAQVNCYMDWTGMHDAFILCVRKGGSRAPSGRPQHDLREIKIQYKPKLLDEIYARWELAQQYISGEKELPNDDVT